MAASVDMKAQESYSREPLPVGDDCLLIIFGASGDLTRRKLIPSLYNLACAGCMHPRFEVLGMGRTRMSSEDFRARMHAGIVDSADARGFTETAWREFASRLYYFAGDVNDEPTFDRLKSALDDMRRRGSSANRLFYVSTPASVAAPIITGLTKSGLNRREGGWTRIVLEKPFGRDLDSARKLNQVVRAGFDERDVYRIDHYLGKETVQNILVFRFGNSMFEPIWNRNFIDRVEITAAETAGVESRGGFYEETGALRDMVANHLLQLLALTAMEPPIAFDADAVREQKVQLLKSIRPMTMDEVARRTVRGQYGPGDIGGRTVPGYRAEKNVSPSSAVETYAALEIHVDNWRWADVPFLIRTGKRLKRHLTEIRVYMKRTPQALFARKPSDELGRNVVALHIQPDEGINIAFDAKVPGSEMRALTVNATFSYESVFASKGPPAYETLLLDSMRGDATLFTRSDEVEAEWQVITPVEQAWASLPAPAFPNYAAGSKGPRGPENRRDGT